jgi:hypothetical protein
LGVSDEGLYAWISCGLDDLELGGVSVLRGICVESKQREREVVVWGSGMIFCSLVLKGY